MDFALPPELLELQAEAEHVGREAATRSDFPEDSWIVGYDPAFTRELGARGVHGSQCRPPRPPRKPQLVGMATAAGPGRPSFP